MKIARKSSSTLTYSVAIDLCLSVITVSHSTYLISEVKRLPINMQNFILADKSVAVSSILNVIHGPFLLKCFRSSLL